MERYKFTNIFNIFLLLMLYKIILDFSYIVIISPNYEYMGFVYTPNIVKFLEANSILFIISTFLPMDEIQPSNIAVNIMLLLNIIPIMSIYALSDESRIYFYTIIISYILILLTIKLVPDLKVGKLIMSNKILLILLSAITLFVYISLIHFNGLPSIKLFDLTKVYSYRANFNYGFKILGYLIPWQANIINMFYLVLSLRKKNNVNIFGAVLLQIILFLLTGNRTILFQPFVVIFMSIFIFKRRLIKFSIKGLILVMIISMLVYFITKNIMLPSLIIRRVLFVPAKLSYTYYDYFSTNGYTYLSHSVFKMFFNKPIYSIPPQELIGNIFWSGSWANTGLFGDAYMNFGIPGVFIFSFLFCIILKVIDSLSNSSNKKFVSCIIVGLFMFNMANTAFFTSLLTGGLLFFILLLWLYQDDEMYKQCGSGGLVSVR